MREDHGQENVKRLGFETTWKVPEITEVFLQKAEFLHHVDEFRSQVNFAYCCKNGYRLNEASEHSHELQT